MFSCHREWKQESFEDNPTMELNTRILIKKLHRTIAVVLMSFERERKFHSQATPHTYGRLLVVRCGG